MCLASKNKNKSKSSVIEKRLNYTKNIEPIQTEMETEAGEETISKQSGVEIYALRILAILIPWERVFLEETRHKHTEGGVDAPQREGLSICGHGPSHTTHTPAPLHTHEEASHHTHTRGGSTMYALFSCSGPAPYSSFTHNREKE